MLAVVGIAALVPAARAGKMGAVEAIAAGRAPRTGGGFTAHRLLGRLRLPRPVTVGLAAPFARPARTAGTLIAILLGATAVTFAVGLSTSLSMVVVGLSHEQAEPVQVYPGNGSNITAAQQRAITAALQAQPDTRRFVAEADDTATIAGLSRQINVTAFAGNATWTGYEMISGHWYAAPSQVDVATGFLTETGKSVGDTVTMTIGGRLIPVRIAGEVFDSNNRGMDIITGTQTVAAAGPSQTQPTQYDIGLRAGTSPTAYAQSLQTKLGNSFFAQVNSRKSVVIDLMVTITGMLTLMLTVVAALGVLNMTVMNTRERVHDLGVPIMASAADLALPPSFLSVYGAWEMAGLAVAGIGIAVLGALLPAGWAAKIRTGTALHAEQHLRTARRAAPDGARPRSSKLRVWSSSRLETGGHTLTMPGPDASGPRYRPGQSGLTSSSPLRTCSTCTRCWRLTPLSTVICSRT
jgi:putative ABC transport system permease protein